MLSASVAAKSVEKLVHSALKSTIVVMYGAEQRIIHKLLAYGTCCAHNFASCTGNERLSRSVVLQLVAEEARVRFGDFNSCKDTTGTPWKRVSNVTDALRANCANWVGVRCNEVAGLMNEFMEQTR
ncbi:hypothetical protein TRVL_07271 [Trypanosoma vivax]|nr:hypothetical protein TRVL_07271 [Trypanosoma vivax]